MSFRRAASTLASRAARALTETSKLSSVAPAASAVLLREPILMRTIKTTSIASSALSEAIRSEIDYEKQHYKQPEELSGGPPAPFTLTESKGDTLMTLSGTHGNEHIEVTVLVNDQPEEEPFEDEDGVLDVDVGVMFNVAVTKDNESLVFECKSDGSYLDVEHVGLEPADGEIDESAYNGPVYEELDEDLQKQLTTYLEERGVTTELGGYLLRLVHDKEQREYMYWLDRVQGFLNK